MGEGGEGRKGLPCERVGDGLQKMYIRLLELTSMGIVKEVNEPLVR